MNNYIEQEAKMFFDNLLQKFRDAGKKHVDAIRSKSKFGPLDNSTFGNITFNLRSSIGYLIIYNGEIVEDYFPIIGGGSKGAETGKSWAREVGLLVNEYQGIQLVVVAGMEYGIFVESKGFDVISLASETELPKIIKEAIG
ncbi:MAG: hypothetical protein EOO42_01265 [Flavobacteriales bacterium]|nr:MAG: hypothetical protein EOO42_01265 [Flavobacteriales bacterium]